MALATIDLDPFLKLKEEGVIANEPSTDAHLAVSRNSDKGCREHGFLHLTNFSVTDALRNKVTSSIIRPLSRR
jgi:hypothetical protein